MSTVAARWGKTSFPRAAGGVIINVGINLLLAYLVQKLREKIDEALIKKQMKDDLEPEIEKYVAARERIILDNLSSGEHAYVTASIEVRTVDMPRHEGGSLPVVRLSSLGISARDWSGSPPKRDVETHWSGLISYINEITFSVEAKAPEEDVKRYSDAQRQLKWYEDTLKNPNLTDSDRSRLKKDRQALFDWIDQAFGKFDVFVPTPANWTDDGYAKISGKSK